MSFHLLGQCSAYIVFYITILCTDGCSHYTGAADPLYNPSNSNSSVSFTSFLIVLLIVPLRDTTPHGHHTHHLLLHGQCDVLDVDSIFTRQLLQQLDAFLLAANSCSEHHGFVQELRKVA